MTDNQFDHSESGLPKFFRPLCGLIERHFEVAGDEAEWLADRLMSHGILNGFPYLAFDRTKDIDALSRIDRALLEVRRAYSDAALTTAAKSELFKNLLFGPQLSEPQNSNQDGLRAYANDQGTLNASAFARVSEETETFRKAIADTIEEIRTSPYAKRSLSLVNINAIGLVEGCRFVWKLATGKEAPTRDLNPATKFAVFLADAMDVCGLDADPRSAFLAWARIPK